MTVVSVLSLPVREGCEAEIAQAYADLRIWELSHESGGFRGGRLLEPVEQGEPFLVIAEWDSAADYQGWLDNPVRESLRGKLDHLLSGEVGAGRVYEVTH